jgi:hypothetical protein
VGEKNRNEAEEEKWGVEKGIRFSLYKDYAGKSTAAPILPDLQ